MTFSSPTSSTTSSIILKIFSAVLHMSEASIDLKKKTVPFGLFTRKLSIVLLLLFVHPSVIIVHLFFFQYSLCSSKTKLVFSTCCFKYFTLISWYDGGLNPGLCLATNSSILMNSSLFASIIVEKQSNFLACFLPFTFLEDRINSSLSAPPLENT